MGERERERERVCTWSTPAPLQDVLEGRLEQTVTHLVSRSENTFFINSDFLNHFTPEAI